MQDDSLIEMKVSLGSIVSSMQSINSNVDKVVQVSELLTERIKILETDLQERVIKKKFYKALIALYPTIMVFLMFLTNVDHHKIESLVNSMNSFLVDAKTQVIPDDY